MGGWVGCDGEDKGGVQVYEAYEVKKKKGKNYAVFCFAGFFLKNFLCYEVIVKQKN